MSLENEVLFGRLAVKLGFVTAEQLADGVQILKQVKGMGRDMSLGEVMLKKKLLTQDQVDRILAKQGEEAESLIDGFKIEKKLGEGGMGKVYKAVQTSMGRVVALKILSPRMGADKVFVQRFFREAKASGRLNHPNIVQGFDSGTCRDKHYIAMEFVDGETADAKIKREGRIAEKEALRITLGVARALEHAHKFAIVHRDIKPDNVLLGKNGEIKVADLGLAKEGMDAGITQVGMAMGTPNYISPEQAKAEENIDIRADIYSLGCSLFHMLTGEVPFRGERIEVILTKHVVEPPRSVRSMVPELSTEVDDLVTKMMAKNPADRYQNPSDLCSVIEAVLKGVPFATAGGKEQEVLARLKQARSQMQSSGPEAVETTQEFAGSDYLRKAKLKAMQKEYAANAIVFYEGQEPDRVFLLLRGSVEILRAGRVIYSITESGTYFGEISMLKKCPREYTARTLAPSVIVELTREQYLKVLGNSPVLCLQLVNRLAELLTEGDVYIVQRDQKLEATRTQLRSQRSREAELIGMLRDLMKIHRKGDADRREKRVFHESVAEWIKEHKVEEWLGLGGGEGRAEA
ncbi:MAG: protein kinase [Planctomycetota bacterium]